MRDTLPTCVESLKSRVKVRILPVTGAFIARRSPVPESVRILSDQLATRREASIRNKIVRSSINSLELERNLVPVELPWLWAFSELRGCCVSTAWVEACVPWVAISSSLWAVRSRTRCFPIGHLRRSRDFFSSLAGRGQAICPLPFRRGHTLPYDA